MRPGLIDIDVPEECSAAEDAPSAAPFLPPLLSVAGLTKSFGGRRAVQDVSFELGCGATGLLGPNGAGKSTLIRCLAGLGGWDEGEVRLGGIEPARRTREAPGSVWCTSGGVQLPPEL